jgi:hypothetical protein
MIKRFSHIALLIILAVPVLLTSCFWTSVPSLPVINSFNSTPAAVAEGNPAVLDWNVSNATALIIDQGVGSVSSTGTSVVMPAATTTYTLTAVNAAGAVTKSVVVTVNSASATVIVPVTPVSPGPLPSANPPGNRDWLASTYTNEYHWPSCSIAQNIPPPSRRWFDTVNQAQANGFHPCPVCRPPR